VDEEILKKISSETGAQYFKADSSNEFKNIFDIIAQLEKTPLEYEIYTSKKSNSVLLLMIILIMLCVLSYLHFYKRIKI
jgi:Ca-activated chloride channel family protein